MKKVIRIFIVLAALSPPGRANVASGRLAHLAAIIPPEKGIIESELVSIVVSLEGNTADHLQISVNNSQQQLIERPDNKDYICKDGIRLSYGMNKIKATGLENGKTVGEITRQVFYKSDLTQSSAFIHSAFKEYSFHVDAYETTCLSCHQHDFTRLDSNALTGEKSPCFGCHKKILVTYAFEHGPAEVWSFLACHDVKSKYPKMATFKPTEKMCANWHENLWSSNKFQQGSTATGICTTCDNPHASDNPNFFCDCHPSICVLNATMTYFPDRTYFPVLRGTVAVIRSGKSPIRSNRP